MGASRERPPLSAMQELKKGWPMHPTEEFRQAISAGHVRPLYQPIVHAGTGQLYALEALARWYHPVRGLVNPSSFIFFAEQNGLLDDVLQAILCRSAAALQSLPYPVRLSVNVSPSQLAKHRFAETFLSWLREVGLAPAALDVEITEDLAFPDEVAALSNMVGLTSCGAKLLLDDFGAGFSGLERLRDLPVSKLKIDRSFIQQLSHSQRAREIITSVISMSHSISVDVVAEGVESERVAEYLAEAGCDYLQGYHFSRPVEIAVIEEMMAGGAFGRAQEAA